MSENPSPVLLLSGGMDSLVLLASLHAEGRHPHCLSVDYGQRHYRELIAAEEIAEHYGVPCHQLELPRGVLPGCLLLSGSPPPAGASITPEASVVPGRNLLLLALGVAHALANSSRDVLIGCHGGDAAVYSDCRSGFISLLRWACLDAYAVSIHAPFLFKDKADILALGRKLDAPLHLAWSCYLGGAEPCGQCGACLSRAAAEASA